MPYSFLKTLCNAPLPQQFDAAHDIDMVLVLVAAGMIEATVPPIPESEDAEEYEFPATVLRVTERGRQVCAGGSDAPVLPVVRRRGRGET